MDITTQTPADIDEAQRQAEDAFGRAFSIKERAERYLADHPTGYAVERMQAEADQADQDMAAARAVVHACQAEYDRRGGWTRYELVANASGHLHAKGPHVDDTMCATCFPTTQYAWITFLSGATPEDAARAAGTQTCLECLGVLLTAEVRAEVASLRPTVEPVDKRAARLEREAKKTERDRKAAEKALTRPDGSFIKQNYGGEFKTEIGARNGAIDAGGSLAWYGEGHPAADAWKRIIAEVVEAIAYKHGTPVEEVQADIDARIAKRVAKDQKEAAKYR